MSIREDYNSWAEQYDTNLNKTRDKEAAVLKAVLDDISFENCLELGCGTGKNTLWLSEKARRVTAVDFSEEMLKKAREKVTKPNVQFLQGNLLSAWNFAAGTYDLLTFSLVLEHLEDLGPVFEKAAACLSSGGHLYLSELHPHRQYAGSKARFETSDGTRELTCFTHHTSDFIKAGLSNGLVLKKMEEYFDEDNRSLLPRILNLLFLKP